MRPFLDRLRQWHVRIEDRLNLRQQVAIATGFLCVAVVVLLAGAAATVGRYEADRAASNTLTDIAVTLADRMKSGVSFYVAFAEHLANLPPLTGIWSSDDDRFAIFSPRCVRRSIVPPGSDTHRQTASSALRRTAVWKVRPSQEKTGFQAD